MRTKDLIQLAEDPNLISGIHNYCDRWCERCTFSARCLVYLSEQQDDEDDPASRDINNVEFWERLSNVFQETQKMITDWAEEAGVDLTAVAHSATDRDREARREDASNHPLAKAAEAYALASHEWFKRTEIETVNASRPDSSAEPTEEGQQELEATEIIRWYQFFIAVKIIRGLRSRVDEMEWKEDDHAKDSDGSIKVALIAIDRSIVAWKLMAEVRTDESQSIRSFMLELEKLRSSTEEMFPLARDFMRPGFDEVSLDMVN
jgi:hypothetical protein